MLIFSIEVFEHILLHTGADILLFYRLYQRQKSVNLLPSFLNPHFIPLPDENIKANIDDYIKSYSKKIVKG